MNSEVLGVREWTSLESHHTPQRSPFPLLTASSYIYIWKAMTLCKYKINMSEMNLTLELRKWSHGTTVAKMN